MVDEAYIISLWQPNSLKLDFLAISQPSPIRTYDSSLESSTQGLSNGVGPIQMRSAVQNAQASHQIAFPKHGFLYIFSTNHPIFFSQQRITKNLFLLVNSYPTIYRSSQTDANSQSKWPITVFICFACSKPTTTAINTYDTPLERSDQGLSNGVCHVPMRSTVKNAHRFYQVKPG